MSATPMDAKAEFEKWLIDWHFELEQVQAHTTSNLPTDPALIHADVNTTTRNYPRVAEWLADVERWLLMSRAAEMLDIKCDPKFKDFTSPERALLVESRISHIARTRDILKAICRALRDRSIALGCQRAYEREALRLTPRGE